MTGVEMIAAERERQMKHEGWTAEHDDEHTKGELLKAAISYCGGPSLAATTWPWEYSSYKPQTGGDFVRDLVKAGALIAAEIDRRLRAEKKRKRKLIRKAQ